MSDHSRGTRRAEPGLLLMWVASWRVPANERVPRRRQGRCRGGAVLSATVCRRRGVEGTRGERGRGGERTYRLSGNLSTRHLRHTHSHVHDDKLGTTKLGISIPVCSDRSVVQTTEFVRFGWVRRSPGVRVRGVRIRFSTAATEKKGPYTHTYTHSHTPV